MQGLLEKTGSPRGHTARAVFGRVLLIVGGLAAGLVVPGAHGAETIRIAQQYGIVYLSLQVIQDRNLLEKNARARGIDLDVEWKQLSGGAAVNSALLSNSIDIAAAGTGPLLTIWDRTKDSLNVKAIASLGHFPNALVTNNPDVQDLQDFTDQDRIAVPAVKVSVQSRFLQMAAAEAFGADRYDALDALTTSLPHPDATNALISGNTELTAHFSNLPFQYTELQDPDVHLVLTSYDILGGKVSPVLVYARQSLADDRPEILAAFVASLEQARDFIEAHPSEAADVYRRIAGAQLAPSVVEEIITSDDVDFSLAPSRTYPLAEFLYRVGAIRHEPTSWRDYFFSEAYARGGS